MSVEREPQHQFPWQRDQQGEYLNIRSEHGLYEIRQENTLMYLFPDQPDADHIFIYSHEDEGAVYGARIWRIAFDDILGAGAFGSLYDQMFDRGFEMAPDEEPSPLDIQSWENHFQREYVKPNPIDKIVELALRNFDDAWRYYSEEWGGGTISDV